MVPDSEIALKFIFRQADLPPDVRERTHFARKTIPYLANSSVCWSSAK